MESVVRVELPEVPITEWTFVDTRTASGLFAHRHLQAQGLLDLPDVGGGDRDAKQRREALTAAVSFRRPLAALSLFLGVVALEDFIRDLVARMAEQPDLAQWFPLLAKFRSQPRARSADQMFRRLDTDPAGVIDPEHINSVFREALGVSPIPSREYSHLRDLALLRHTVAHHAAVIRTVDAPRFGYFLVQPGRVINPPVAFVRSELHYLYRLGRDAEAAVRHVVFRRAVDATGPGWSTNPPDVIQRLVEFFAYFGYIETADAPVGYSESGSAMAAEQESEGMRIREALVARCIAELTRTHGQ